MRPWASTTSFTSRSAASGSESSTAWRVPLCPTSATHFSVSSASFVSPLPRCEIATSAPSRANAIATARPMPLSPPVMSATRSRSRPWPT